MFDWLQPEKYHKITDGDEVELLTTVTDVAVLGIVRGLLEEENIPYLKKDRGTGGAMRIMMGQSFYGTDIYVPEGELERALELITPADGATFEETDAEEAGEEETEA